jgi:hypothetical protein
MASSKMKALIGCGVVVIGGSVLLCGGLVAVLAASPWLLVQLVTQDAPLDIPKVEASESERIAVGQRVCTELARQGSTQVSGDELTQLMMTGPDAPPLVRIAAEGDQAVFDLSVETEPGNGKWVNVHGRGGMVMENGWFVHFTMDEITVGDWDLGQYTAGQELMAQANQNLAQQRAQNPEQYAVMDGIDRLSVEGGAFTMALKEGSTLPACAGIELLPEPEPEPTAEPTTGDAPAAAVVGAGEGAPPAAEEVAPAAASDAPPANRPPRGGPPPGRGGRR